MRGPALRWRPRIPTVDGYDRILVFANDLHAAFVARSRLFVNDGGKPMISGCEPFRIGAHVYHGHSCAVLKARDQFEQEGCRRLWFRGDGVAARRVAGKNAMGGDAADVEPPLAESGFHDGLKRLT